MKDDWFSRFTDVLGECAAYHSGSDYLIHNGREVIGLAYRFCFISSPNNDEMDWYIIHYRDQKYLYGLGRVDECVWEITDEQENILLLMGVFE